MATDHANPYRSPVAPVRAEREIFNSARSEVCAELESRGWLYRRIRLGGRIEADVAWNARGPVETVRVVGRLAVSHSPVWYQPRFDFVLRDGVVTIPAVIRVRLSRLLPLLVRWFQLEVDGAVVYQEGRLPAERTG